MLISIIKFTVDAFKSIKKVSVSEEWKLIFSTFCYADSFFEKVSVSEDWKLIFLMFCYADAFKNCRQLKASKIADAFVHH